jgi:UDP-glucose 4-epimerase
MLICITGVLGFLGSHLCVELLKLGHNIIGIDNLSNSDISVLDKLLKFGKIEFFQIDIQDKKRLKVVFQKYSIECVIHMAGLKSVSESIMKPLAYYHNNMYGTLCLLETMQCAKMNNLIFSSSATVYGENNYPVNETATTGQGITNPYGRTKYFIEEMLKDMQASEPDVWSITCLRYFNPVSSCYDLEEQSNGTNLFPHVLKHAKNGTTLKIFGSDYDTKDGTCIRDFIHVQDLSLAHVAALQKCNEKGLFIYNVGTGQGSTVLELVNTFQETNNVKLNYEFVGKRPGDVAIAYAKVNKIEDELHWKACKSLKDCCRIHEKM